MSLKDNILQDRKTVAQRWFQKVLDTYPPDTARFLRAETDGIRNPVGGTIAPALEKLLVAIVEEGDPEAVEPPLDDIIRIRAVQDFTASAAVAFVFQLKQVLRQHLGAMDGPLDPGLQEELRTLEARIDVVALRAFDVYMNCREQVYSIKAERARRETSLLLERTHKIWKGGSGR